MPNLQDVEYRVEDISSERVYALARKRGWTDGDDCIRDYVEPEDAARYTAHATLEEATAKAVELMKAGNQFWGAVIIDRWVFEQPHDDRGVAIRGVPLDWERYESWEVAGDGERIQVER